jgi:hypothetical protein
MDGDKEEIETQMHLSRYDSKEEVEAEKRKCHRAKETYMSQTKVSFNSDII